MRDREYALVEQSLANIRRRIAENIANKKRLDGLGVIKATGRTIASIEVAMNPDGGALLGREHFEELETGIPPRQQPANFADIIREWAEQKPIYIKDEPFFNLPYDMQDDWAEWVAEKIKRDGSILYRTFGGRTDVFTPVIEDEVAKLENELPNIVTETISDIIYGRQ